MTERGLGSPVVRQKAREFSVLVCREVLPVLPPEERSALGAQLRRSLQNVPANIAEVYGRYYFQEGVRVCYIARGSLEETYTHICLASDLGYLPAPLVNQLIQGMHELRRLLSGTIAFLKRSRRGKGEPGADPSIPQATPCYTRETEDERNHPEQDPRCPDAWERDERALAPERNPHMRFSSPGKGLSHHPARCLIRQSRSKDRE
jgi:four helix bundle protein